MEVQLSKIDFDSIISEYQILNRSNFKNYLYYIWKDLSNRTSNNEQKGISKLVFSHVLLYFNDILSSITFYLG